MTEPIDLDAIKRPSGELYARLERVITERLETSRAAARALWDFASAGFPRSPGRDAVVALINATVDPAFVIRACERDLWVLHRHAPGPSPVGDADDADACIGCTHDNLSAWPCWRSWPCKEITELASVYLSTEDDG